MASIDEVSSNDTNGLFTNFFDSEKTDWNGREVVDLTSTLYIF